MNNRPEGSKSFRSTLFAALLGGLVVAVLGFGAVSAGLIGKNETTTKTIATASPVANDDEDQGLVNQIYEQDSQGVGFVTASGVTSESSPFDPYGQGEGSGTATGSGFLIDKEGHMVTNNHVVEGAQEIDVTLGDSDASYSATVVGTDPSTDLALLKVDAPEDSMTPLAIGDSDGVEVGDPVIAIGNPFGLDRTVTTGIVSALQREIQSTTDYSISNVIQTDAAINPGNSGGPLINDEGEVIGVNSQIATGGSGSSGSVGIGFAIPAETVKDVVSQIKEDGDVEHAFLGVSGATLSPDIADALNLDNDSGVLIQEATKGGPADEAGIEGGDTAVTVDGQKVLTGGDIITAVNGEEVTSMEEVVALINEAAVGDSITVTVDRDGESKDFDVTLASRPDDSTDESADSEQEEPQQQLPPGFGQ